MASGSAYALPTVIGGGHSHGHGHSRSYSATTSPHLSPNKAAANGLPTSNGCHGVKKAVSQSSLFPHAETSRETSPLPSPGADTFTTPFEFNNHRFEDHRGSGLRAGSPWKGHTRMKSRPRGDSDLMRPADARGPTHKPTLGTVRQGSKQLPFRSEAATALLIPLPYLFASAAYSAMTFEELSGGTHQMSAHIATQHGANALGRVLPRQKFSSDSGFLEACTLTSGTLLLVGVLAKLRAGQRQLDRRKEPASDGEAARALLQPINVQRAALRATSLGLPFFSAMQIGGLRTGLVLLTAMAAELTTATPGHFRSWYEWKHILSARIATVAVLMASMVMDFAGLTFLAPTTHVMAGYLVLAVSVLVLPLPFASLASQGSRSASRASSPHTSTSSWSRIQAASPLTASTTDVNTTIASGVAATLITILLSIFWAKAPPTHGLAMFFSTLTIATMSAAILFAQPHRLRTVFQAGLGAGCLLTASCAFLYSPTIWPGTFINGGLSALSYLGVLYDTRSADDDSELSHDHHVHHDHSHHHDHAQDRHQPVEANQSVLTKFIINHCTPGSLLYGILSDKDSRRIAYFTILNFAFMIVQGIYGYISGSLGLLSDTVHMFFDCLGLVVGLGAAVASKWPTSPEKPYGWGKLNTLAGFGNGVFLMLVSVEFVWEAIEGIVEGKELRHVQELLVVSVAGFLVNMVGLLAFGHAHAGHDHGSHGHDHGHSHVRDHSVTNGHAHHADCDHNHSHAHKARDQATHGHDHGHNDNMHGIFLHVAADAGGSLAVIISTALTLWRPWYFWDPLATIIIAVLIFAAAIPLVISSGQKLLLVIPDQLEYSIKNILQDISEMRDVVGYAVPRFWLDDRDSIAAVGGHDHDHYHHGARDEGEKVMGVIHIIAAQNSDLEDVRARVEDFAREKQIDLVVHVERETDATCWCGGAPGSAQSTGSGMLKAG